MEKDRILLNELINGSITTLPDFVWHKNVVYCCENLLNGKIYIGETKRSLYERWCDHKHQIERNKDNSMAIYSAIRKYGQSNFAVYILEEGFSSDELRKESEKSWIKKLNSFHDTNDSNGYNLTTGGTDKTKFSKLDIEKRKKTCIEKYGCLPIHTEESRKKALETNRKNHGGKLAFQDKKYREKALATQIKKYGMLALHLDENKEKAKNAMRKKYGDVLPFNTKESIKKAQSVAPLYRMIGCINRHLQILYNKGLEVNAYNYVMETNDLKHMWQQHIPNVLNKIEKLREISKWTQEMEIIFSNIEYRKQEKGIKKIKFKNEN